MMIDIEKLRNDMEDYYGTAMFGGFPMAVIELNRIQRASNEDIIQMAIDQGIDLRKYQK